MSSATPLAASSSHAQWTSALSSYPASLESHSHSSKRRAKLIDLDDFVRKEVPERVRSRYSDEADGAKFGYLKKEELCKIVEWKITRGKFRPLMRYANALGGNEVQVATKEAFRLAEDDPKAAMEELIKLKGIGPATASAILSLASAHENCPFLSDEAMRAFDIVNKAGKLDYTMATWASLTKACEEKAEELNKAGGDDETEDAVKWSPVKVERAIWADSVKQGKTES